MKKRIISLLMALVMTVSLLPTAVWAAEASPQSGAQTGTDDTVYPVKPDVAVQTIGADANAVENAVAEVIDADGHAIGQYATIAAAIKAAEDNYTVKLLNSGETYTLPSYEDEEKDFPICIEYDDITLDLNGCTLKRSVSERQHGILKVSRNVEVLLRNGTLYLDDSASEYDPAQAIKMQSDGSPTLTLENMTIEVADIDAEAGGFRTAKGYAISAEGGTLNIKSGTYGKVLIHDGNVTAKLSGGSYESVMCYYNRYAEFLEKGYIFATQDGSYINPSTMENVSDNESIKNVKVIPCTHKDGNTNLFVDGTCSRCDLTCTKHTHKDGNCGTCGQAIVANDGSNYYVSLSEALEQVADDGTLDALITLPPIALAYNYGKSVTLFLNGQHLTNNDAGATLTVSAGKLAIAVFNPDYPPTIGNSGGGYAVEVTGGTLEFADTDCARGSAVLKGGIHVTGGTLAGGLKEGSILTRGSGSSSVSVAGDYEFVYELLEEGCAFAKATVTTDPYENVNAATTVGDIIPANVSALTEDVIVVKCTHKGAGGASLFEDGECTACGFACEHETVVNNICSVCDGQMMAQDNTDKYYLDLADALEGVADGGTVTMLADANEWLELYHDEEGALADKTVTLYMDGHSLYWSDESYNISAVGIESGKLIIADDAVVSQLVDDDVSAVSVGSNGDDKCALEFQGKATITGGMDFFGYGKLEGGLKEGSIVTSNSSYSVSVEASETYKTVLELLPEGCAFAEYDKATKAVGDILPANVNKLTEDVIVVRCSHKNVDETSTVRMFEKGVCSACGYVCPHEHLTNTTCSDCGAQMVAQVGERYYSTLAAAIEAAKNNGVVTLVDLGEWGVLKESITIKTGTDVTINVNNVYWDSGDAASPLLTVDGGSVTLNGNGYLRLVADSTAGSVVLVKSGSLKLGEAMEFGNYSPRVPAIDVQGGTLTLGTDTRLYNGITTSVAGATLASYLPEGTAFEGDNLDSAGGFITNGYVQKLTKPDGKFLLTVVSHTTHSAALDADGHYVCVCGYTCDAHDFADGVCKKCGYACLHKDVTEKGPEGHRTAACDTCGQPMAVKVTSGGTTTYYTQMTNPYGDNTLKTILNGADGKSDGYAQNGSTVTLLTDNLNANAVVNNSRSITLDLNGKKLIETDGIRVDAGSKLTVTGEGSSSEDDNSMWPCVFNVQGGTLEFKETKFGGTFNNIRVGSGTLTSPREKEDAIKIGTLEIGGANAKVSFKAAAFDKIVIGEETSGVSVTLGDLLGVWKDAAGNTVRSGNAFQKADGTFLPYDTVITKGNPVVNVKTAACHHDSLGTENTCDYCGWAHLVAIYTTDSGVVGTLTPATEWTEDAINEAANTAFRTWNNMGGTLKLFADFALEDRTITNKYANAIDLNGHTITGGTLTLADGTNVTIKDSSEGKTGSIANVTVNGGAALTVESGISVGKITAAAANAEVTLEEGAKLKGYKLPYGMILADWLEDGCYLWDGTNRPNLVDSTGIEKTSTSGEYAVTKAPVAVDAGTKTGSLPVAGLFPQDIIPSITPDENAGVTKVEIAWYFRGNDGAANMLSQNPSRIYFDGSEENWRGKIYMTIAYKRDYPIGSTMDVFCHVIVDKGDARLCSFVVSGYQLTVTAADLSEAAVTVTNGSELVYGAPSGTAETRTLVFTVENAVGDTLREGTHYIIRNNSNTATEAGEHTLVLEGVGDYAGTLEYQWEIAPLTLGGLAEQNIIRKDYDGTAALPSDFVFTPSFLVNNSWYALNPSDYTMEGSYDSAAAGENKTATFRLTLTGENYRFSNGEKTMEVTISKDCNILKADAPAAQDGALTVTNQRKAAYTYDVSALLPELDGEKTYGDVTYSVYDVTLGRYYAASEQASIDANGLLTLPIQRNETDAEGAVGTVRIWVESTNYRGFALTINVSATNKIVPTGAPVLSGTTLSYGDKLSGITLSGAMRDGSKAVKGTFAWDNADAVMDKLGSYQAAWTFTPEDTDHYAAAQGTAELTVQPRDIAGARITLGAELTYNGLRQTQRVTSVTVDGRDVTYTVSGDTAVNAGEYTLTVTGTDNYTGTAQAKWTIAKADAVLTAAPEAVDGLLHTGKAQALVTAGKASGGTLVYSLTENGTYTETIPTGSKVGSYTVWYKVEGDRNHNDTAAQSVTVAISKADDPVYAISGAVRVISVSGEDEGAAAGAVVTVRKGTEQIGKSVTTDSEGAFRMDPVRPGLYNVVAQYNGKTVTQMVEITDHAVKDLTITVFREDVSSTLDIKASGELTEELVVGGLDKEAAAQFDENTSSVRMDLRVVEMPADKNDAVQKALHELASGKELSFLDITPMLTRNGGAPERISGTKTVLEIVISYNTSRKGITVLRYHNGAAQELTKLAALPTVPEDFTFYVDTVNQRIHIFTSQFSTYAIGYTRSSGNGGNGGNGGSASSAVSSGASTSPSTGDAGLLAYGIMALSSYTGTALLLRRRKRED